MNLWFVVVRDQPVSIRAPVRGRCLDVAKSGREPIVSIRAPVRGR